MLLIALFLLLYLITYITITKKKTYCITIILFVSICYITNEVFSLFNILDKNHIKILYSLLSVVLIGIIGWNLKKKSKKIKIAVNFSDFINFILEQKLLILFLIFSVLILGLSISTVPYNWDAMTYHLPRIAQWTQNKSVAHYAVEDIRQVTSPTLAEFINLQVFIMSGKKDIWLNLLQTTSFFTNAGLVYFITKRLGGSRNYCWLSVLLFMSMPIAFAEALSTQVDHFSTMWLLIFIYFLLDILDLDYHLTINRDSITKVVILSSCIGFGYLAKASILFAMVFFALWLLGVCIYRKDKVRDILFLISLAVVVICLIVLPEISRNLVSFGAISAPAAGARQLIGTLNPIYMFVNGLKNYMMNLPNVYIRFEELLSHIVYWFTYILRVEINHPSIAEDGREFFLHSPETYGHDTAINPIIVITATVVMVCLLIKRFRRDKMEFAEKYSWAAFGSFIVFCIFLRWEPYVTRYMLSYLAILCPVIAVWLAKMEKRKWAHALIGIISFLCIMEMPKLFEYHSKICVEQNAETDRLGAYFIQRRKDKDDYAELIRILNDSSYDNLGLYLGGESFEYPIWAMLEKEVRIENVMVSNETAKYADKGFVPEAIVVIGKDGNNLSNYQGKEYVCYEQISDIISIWKQNE